jgi:peptidylprolyl isomerase/peptidyl-prolyl cis-trans isomerase C
MARGGLPPSIDAVVWALKPGELSEIVPTAVGFHVFRLEKVLPAEKTDLANATAGIRIRLRPARELEAREAIFQQLLPGPLLACLRPSPWPSGPRPATRCCSPWVPGA